MYLTSGACIATLIFCTTLSAQTIPKKASSLSASPGATASPSASPSQPGRPIPFHGMVSAVDQKAKTFTIAGKEKPRTFKVTDKTAIMKGAPAATMKDIVENEEVSGAYWKNPGGTLEAKMVKIGPMSSPEKGKKASASATASPKASPSPKISPKS